jgi:hypothetical protein
MFYSYRVLLPANTPINNPVIQVLRISQGIITNIEVEFPAGCQGLAFIQLSYETAPILPYNPTVYLVSDNRTIQSPIEFEAFIPPYEIIARGYNLDDSYDHTINIGISITPYKEKSIQDLVMGV